MKSTYKKFKINFLLFTLSAMLLSTLPAFAQQWFVRDFDISSSINQVPDFRASGTSVTYDASSGERGVLVYGNIAYSENELTAAEGGFGGTDIVILHNDVEGNNQWALTFGTSNKDVVSRVVMDSDGNLALSGYTVSDEGKQVFIAKIDVTSLNVIWANLYGSGVPTDFINVYSQGSTGGNSTGYAACGISGGQSFIIHTDLNGSISTTGHWAHYYTVSSFRSIIQMKSRGAFVGASFVFIDYFAVAGENIEGYAASIDATTGDIDKDLDLHYTDFSPCETTPRVSRYVSLDQDQNGDISLLGYSGDEMHLTRINSNFKVDWDQEVDFGFQSFLKPHDLNATSFGYLAVFQRSSNLLGLAQYDFDGNVTGLYDLTSNWDWQFTTEPSSNNMNQLPLLDFDMECGKALHYSGTEEASQNPPANWAIDRIPHAKWRLHADNCVSEDLELENEKCIPNLEWQPEILGSKEGVLTSTPFSPSTAEITPSTDTYCESSCPTSECTSPNYIYGPEGSLIGLYALGNGNVQWSTGSTSDQISVKITRQTEIYTIDRIDDDGCVTTVVYHIFDNGLGKKGANDNLTLEEKDNFTELSVFPNPTKGLITIEIPNDGVNLEIFDTTGKLIKRINNLMSGEHSIDLTGHPSGLYIIKASGNNIMESFIISKE